MAPSVSWDVMEEPGAAGAEDVPEGPGAGVEGICWGVLEEPGAGVEGICWGVLEGPGAGVEGICWGVLEEPGAGVEGICWGVLEEPGAGVEGICWGVLEEPGAGVEGISWGVPEAPLNARKTSCSNLVRSGIGTVPCNTRDSSGLYSSNIQYMTMKLELLK